MLKGIDISNYQRNLNLEEIADEIDFVIIKATDGTDYISPALESQFIKARELNKLVGLYHFARPNINNTVDLMRKEAEHFVRTITNAGWLEPEAILILDFEIAVDNQVELIDAFMEKVIELTGIKPFLYSFYAFLALPQMKEIISKYLIWMAWYDKYDPNKGEMPETDIPWSIWQYTGNGKLGKYSPLDLNVALMDTDSWIFAGVPKSSSITPALKWCQDRDLLPSNLSGSEHITVNSLAEFLYKIFK